MDSSGQASFEELAEFIEDAETFAVCGHINPDGDSIGSVLGMTAALRQAGKEATPLLADGVRPPHKYSFLEGYCDFVRASDCTGIPDVLIQVDTATPDRMGEARAIMQQCAKSISIDHHPGEGIGADMERCDASACSASILVWQLAKAMVGEPDPFVAAACYTGILTDTGCFLFQNANSDAFAFASEMVEAGADPSLVANEVYHSKPLGLLRLEGRIISRIEVTPEGRVAYSWTSNCDNEELDVRREDAEGLVDIVRSVDGIDVAVLMRGRKDDIRCSIRSKGAYDVSGFARQFGGGGHRAAAGFTVEGHIEQEKSMIVSALEELERHIIAVEEQQQILADDDRDAV